MSLLNFFFPRIVKLPDTKFNRNLYINFYGGQEPTLIGNGLIQSGHIMRSIWRQGMSGHLPYDFVPQKVLLLGLGTGSNARLISSLYPNALITAVEIDPGMEEIARKYCDLNKLNNLTVVIKDAFDFARDMKENYDLTLVDCFDGKYIPTKLERLDFYQLLKDHSRFILTNRLWHAEHITASQTFMNSLSTKFDFVKVHTRTNVIISLV